MRIRSLQSRFLLAGSLLVLSTIVGSVWSVWTFARLATVVGDTVRASQKTIDLTVELHNSLEREDDALLLFLGGQREPARRALLVERERANAALLKLLARPALVDVAEASTGAELQRRIAAYRAAGNALLERDEATDGLDYYHRQINSRLREAVAACDELRETNFQSMQAAAVQTGRQARASTLWVSAIGVVSVVVGIFVAVWLARSVLSPIEVLTATVEVIREGDFTRRVRVETADELGQLALGVNRMADSLAEFRRSSLGELLAAKGTLEAALNALPEAVFVFGPDRELIARNPQGHRLLQALQCAADDSGLDEICWDVHHRDAVEAALQGSVAADHAPDFRRTWNVPLDGQVRRYWLTAVPIESFRGGRTGAVAVAADVTEFARLDELRSELIGVASHELKSPLTSLQMNLWMLRESSAEFAPRQTELMRAAVDGCTELGQTIEELLDVTRIEAGQLRLNLETVDLRSIVRSVADSWDARMADAGVRLEVTTEEQPALVRGDPSRLRSVLGNLLSNAQKYSSIGDTVRLQVTTGQNAGGAPRETVQIAVTDEGPGVPAEFLERIFEKFFRVEHRLHGRPKTPQGTGIGLYLCREIMKAHGGEIRCDSPVANGGTRLAFWLPRLG